MSTKQRLIPSDNGLTIASTAVFIAGEMAGAGILALPKAVDDTGWAGLILIVLCGILSAYTGILLGEAWTIAIDMFDDCKGHVQNPYQLLGQKTYGKAGRYTISICLHITIFGIAVVFLLLAANNMETLVGALGHNISFCFWQLIIAGCLIPLTWFGTPKHFWFVAYGATVATASAAVLIVVYSIMDAPNQPIVYHQEPNVKKIVLALGTIVFAFSGHPIFLTVQMDMKRMKDFKKAFCYALVITTLIYLPPVSAGYFVYGNTLDANVLNNLPSGGLTYTALLLITIHLVLAFIIVLNPLLQEVELLLHLSKEFTWKRCVARFFVVVSILFVAETLPTFDAILSLMGGSSMIIIAFVCPPLFHMKMVKMKADADEQIAEDQNADALQAPWDKQTELIPMWKKVLNYAIICIAVLIGLAISVFAIINIVSPESFSLPCYVNISWATT